MRIHGTLTKWNDDRGFGFITPAKGSRDIFVHISEFPREGGRPTVDELVSFEVVPGEGGKQKAVRVMRPAQKVRVAAPHHQLRRPKTRWGTATLPLLVLAGLGAYGYSKYTQRTTSVGKADFHEAMRDSTSQSSYACDGRKRCSEMNSCEEATFFIRNCPGTEMDGDNDGVPCETQWCN